MTSKILILDDNNPSFIIGELEVTDARIYERINDKYTFEFTCYEQPNTNFIAQQTIIYADDDYFRIATVKETPVRRKYEVYCEHISYELNVVPSSTDEEEEEEFVYNGWIADVIAEMLEGTRFSFDESDDLPLVDNFVTKTKGIRSRILELCEYCSFEVHWKQFTVYIQAQRGHDNGLTIELGKNLKDLTIDKTFEFDGSITESYDIDFIDLNKIVDESGNPLEANEFHMGDIVYLKLSDTRIVQQRGVAVGYNPFSRALPTIELQSPVRSIVEDIANASVSSSNNDSSNISQAILETKSAPFTNGVTFGFTQSYTEIISCVVTASSGASLTYALNRDANDKYVSVTVNGTATGTVSIQAVCKL